MNRIPTLDGWRGIAILIVLADHLQLAANGHYATPWTAIGQHGVTIFFVLSGFLITSKLTENPIDLRSFYTKRFFRLMPAAWLFLAALAFVGWKMNTQAISSSALSGCLFFYRNFQSLPNDGLNAHFWSLALEEQFYLAWPLILILAGVRRSRWIAGAGAVACAAYRYANWAAYDGSWSSRHSEVRADALLVGCLAALLLRDPRFRTLAARWSKVLALPAAAVVCFCMASFAFLPPLYESVCIAILICASSLNPDSLPSRMLQFRPLAKLGMVSYSVYLWQELFMGFQGWELVGGVCLGLPLMAIVSYEYIELPSTKLGSKLAKLLNSSSQSDRFPSAAVVNP